jgi:predicted nucleotidyltransferase
MSQAGLDIDRLKRFVESGPTPLFATVSGAHLYGFESPDSDVDLRGSFVLTLREVIGMKAPTETVTLMDRQTDLDMDWVAHDVLKFARLMTKRNGYVLEQLYSPLVVYGGAWLDELRHIGRGCIVRHLQHHYRGFYFNQRRALERPERTVKELLYAYRVLLTGLHVLRSGRIEANLTVLNDHFKMPDIGDLVARKRSGAEHGALAEEECLRHMARLDTLAADLETAARESTLPDEPTTLAELNEYVVRARLALGNP